MEKKPLLSKQLKLLKSEKWKPYIRYKKETDTWIAKAVREERSDIKKVEGIVDKTSSKIKVLMEREDLDIIARIIAYMYHDKKDDYIEIASELRKEHIYKDLRSINQWLDIQYQKIEAQDEKYKKLNELDREIINEQSK